MDININKILKEIKNFSNKCSFLGPADLVFVFKSINLGIVFQVFQVFRHDLIHALQKKKIERYILHQDNDRHTGRTPSDLNLT